MEHPERKRYWIGGSTAATILAHKFAAPVLNRYLGRTGVKSQQTDEPAGAGRPVNRWEPVDEEPGTDFGAHGQFDDQASSRSDYDKVVEAAETAGAAVTRAFGSLITTARRRPAGSVRDAWRRP